MKIGNITFGSGTLFISLGILMGLLIIGTVITSINSASAIIRKIGDPRPDVKDPAITISQEHRL